MFQLEALGLAVLKLANGTRRRSEIGDELSQSIERGVLTLQASEGEAPTGAALRAALIKTV